MSKRQLTEKQSHVVSLCRFDRFYSEEFNSFCMFYHQNRRGAMPIDLWEPFKQHYESFQVRANKNIDEINSLMGTKYSRYPDFEEHFKRSCC